MYADDEKMQMMYGGFESWLNKYGKDIIVGKNSNKTLHLVMAWWTLKDNDMSRLWNWNATSAKRRRRTMGIVPIRVTI